MNRWKKRIGYGVGDLGCNLVFSTMASYLMFFYTDVFGITATVAGTLMLVTKIIDALTDTGMGLLVDRTKTKWGQGRPYFLIGAIPFAVLTVMTFMVPDFSMTGKIIWAYVTYCLLSTAYTVVNIPLNTIVPRLTSDIHERNCLVSSRMICALLGTALVMSITMPLVNFFGQGDTQKGFLITMSLYGVGAMLLFLFTFMNTKEVIPPSIQPGKSSFKNDLKGITDQTVIFFIVNFLYFALFVIRNTTVIYYFTYNLGRTDWLTFVGLFGILSGLPMLLLLPWLQKKMPKKHVLLLSAAIYIMGDLMIFFGKSSAVFLIAGLAITGLGIYGIFGTTFAIQPDVIDYSEYKKNKSISGMIAAFQGFSVKGSMGLASAAIGFLLSLGGYVPNAAQTETALQYIEICFIWIPLVICLLISGSMWFYKLDDKRKEMSVELESRRSSFGTEKVANL
ncbi:MFS transporter [Halobacillus karajensis]|uniref:Inner membrane symporter YicJ n=1 Tax=Halobacillus karajensis TaxID=195088 RepID=A0A024P2L3_9BACI|nr:MFS transporter [Halobacillus karajensis]CDQ19389.1 Inner membrane symporter YicJ [Halobacillus karajensis]CDQ21852.1 Inner membrane symporter YicJ [Halobacillus karajensis]CDQ27692.1 Inner membrane symporter YicJ [Halobacillus karajensis]